MHVLTVDFGQNKEGKFSSLLKIVDKINHNCPLLVKKNTLRTQLSFKFSIFDGTLSKLQGGHSRTG
jgi:hypothetical protein